MGQPCDSQGLTTSMSIATDILEKIISTKNIEASHKRLFGLK
jgi:hypothetical protein